MRHLNPCTLLGPVSIIKTRRSYGTILVRYIIIFDTACRRCSNYIFILDLALGLMDWVQTTARRDEKYLNAGIWCAYIRGSTVVLTKWYSMSPWSLAIVFVTAVTSPLCGNIWVNLTPRFDTNHIHERCKHVIHINRRLSFVEEVKGPLLSTGIRWTNF